MTTCDQSCALFNQNIELICSFVSDKEQLKCRLFTYCFSDLLVAMAQRGTRSTSVLFNIQDTVFTERKLLDITKPIQVPSVRYVTERYFTIKKEYGCKDFAFKEVACELQELWIFLNLQPMCHSQIVLMVKKLIEKVLKIKKCPLKKHLVLL